MKKRLELYIKDLYFDLNKEEEKYLRLMELIDNTELAFSKIDKDYYLKELANVAGRKDVLRDTIECLEDIFKEEK